MKKDILKSSCIFVSGGISGSDSDGVTGPNTGNFDNLGNDARSINKVKLKFTFDGIERELYTYLKNTPNCKMRFGVNNRIF